MTPNSQLIKHDPENGFFGDCHRTCIATILDMLPQDVPHFINYPEGSKPENYWLQKQRKWLAQRGLSVANIAYDCNFETLKAILRVQFRGVPVILGGQSEIGVGHSVVAFNGRIINDPSGNGIVGPMSDGFYWVTIISVGGNWCARTEPDEQE